MECHFWYEVSKSNKIRNQRRPEAFHSALLRVHIGEFHRVRVYIYVALALIFYFTALIFFLNIYIQFICMQREIFEFYSRSKRNPPIRGEISPALAFWFALNFLRRRLTMHSDLNLQWFRVRKVVRIFVSEWYDRNKSFKSCRTLHLTVSQFNTSPMFQAPFGMNTHTITRKCETHLSDTNLPQFHHSIISNAPEASHTFANLHLRVCVWNCV